ncbi:MAG TPA: hypothetical protein VIL42_04030 [Sphingomicrobium sp.]
MSRASKIAFIVGSDKHDHQDWSTVVNFDLNGSTDLFKLIGLPNSNSFILHFAKSYFRQVGRHRLSSYDLLINLVTDPDQNPKVLNVISKALKGCDVPVLNRPEYILRATRNGTAQMLASLAGLVVPRVVRVRAPSPSMLRSLQERRQIKFPVILRRAGSHGGQIIGLFDHPDQIPQLRAEAAGFTATEFIDFRSADGLYRKYRAFLIGGELVFRHLLISDAWNIHMADRKRFMAPRDNLVAESEAFYQRGSGAVAASVRSTLLAIAEKLQLDFFGVDFGLSSDGHPILFEANPTMNFLPISSDPKFAAMQSCVPPAQEALARLIRARGRERFTSDIRR